MAAGQGFIEFSTGDILTAAAANGYLASQVVMVFADAAARTTAITSPQEGMISYLKDTNATQYYSGSAWVSIGGGSPLTTKGDLYTYSTTDARLGVGTNGQVLTADSTAATGLAWASAASGGGMTLLSTTSLSGVTTTISSISGSYTNLQVYIKGLSASANANVFLRLNGDSGNAYWTSATQRNGSSVTGVQNKFTATYIPGDDIRTGTGDNGMLITNIYRYTDTSYIAGDIFYQGASTAPTTYWGMTGSYIFNAAAAITSITISNLNSANLSGTVYIYGVK